LVRQRGGVVTVGTFKVVEKSCLTSRSPRRKGCGAKGSEESGTGVGGRLARIKLLAGGRSIHVPGMDLIEETKGSKNQETGSLDSLIINGKIKLAVGGKKTRRKQKKKEAKC